jgi:hypothetical protein
MHNRLHYLMVVGQGLILPLFPGCNKDEPIFGKLDIDYVDINSDAKLFYEFVCHKDLLIQHAQKITSKTFTNTHIEETINKQELGQFITELEELNRKADEYLEAIIRLQNVGVLQRRIQTRGVLSYMARFFHWISEVKDISPQQIVQMTVQKGIESGMNFISCNPNEIASTENNKAKTDGKVTIKEKNKEKSSSIVILGKKEGSTNNDGSPTIYCISKDENSESIDMQIQSGEWMVTVISEIGNHATIEIEVKEGETTLTEVFTGELDSKGENQTAEYEFRIKIDKFKLAADFDKQRIWMEYSEESDGFEPLTYKNGYYVATMKSDFEEKLTFKFKIDFTNKKLLLAEHTTSCHIFTFKNIPVSSWSKDKMTFVSSGDDLYERFSYQNYNDTCKPIVGMGFEFKSKAMIEIRRR